MAFLGRTMQVAFVARDVEALIHSWAKVLGVGRFALITDSPPVEAVYHGQPTRPKLLMGWSFHGDTQIAVLQQLNDAPSPYVDFLASGREGIEHLGFWPPQPALAHRRLIRAGLKRIYEIPASGAVYYEPPPGMDANISLLEPSRQRDRIYRALKARVRNWNGRKPVQRYATMRDFLDDLGVT